MKALPRLMVAPNGARRTKSDHSELPMSIQETVATARACYDAGADGLHAHIRDATGAHVLDAGLYLELLAELAQVVPKMAVQITTEAVGRYSPSEQRALVATLQPEAVSIALREMTADGDLAALRRFYHDSSERGIAVQHILYDAEDATHLVRLVESETIPKAPKVLIVLGRYDVRDAAPSDLDAPRLALASLGPIDWAVCAFGKDETACLLAGHAVQGKMRVGFENNFYHAGGGVAVDNAARVKEIRQLTAAFGTDCTTLSS